MSETLRVHDIHLADGDLRLRPMTEADWDLLKRWNTDRDVLYFAEGDDVPCRALAETQAIYRGVSQRAFNFVAMLGDTAVGECWLQEMNLDRILSRHPAGARLHRIDLMVGEKRLWGRGLGTRMIRLLTGFGFDTVGADAIYACDIADYNPASRRAFEKNGYVVEQVISQRPGRKAREAVDMVLRRERYADWLRHPDRP